MFLNVKIEFVDEISKKLPNDLLRINVYKTLECC